jgi:hypothetical protein
MREKGVVLLLDQPPDGVERLFVQQPPVQKVRPSL